MSLNFLSQLSWQGQTINSIAILLLLFASCNREESPFVQYDYQITSRVNLAYDTIKIDNQSIIIHNPYKKKGVLTLKGAMHIHTNNSIKIDGYGSGEPYVVAKKYRDAGYDFYTFTDHNVITEDPGIEGIVWMGLSVEDTKKNQHICAYNLPSNIYVDKGNDLTTLLNYYHSIGAFTSLAHPNWEKTYITNEILNIIDKLDFMEVINPNDTKGHRCLDFLLSKKIMTFSFGVDDYHCNILRDDPNKYFNKAWITAFANKKNRQNIWHSLLQGTFYVSNGPEIDVSFEEGNLIVSSNKKSSITYIGCFNNKEKIILKQEIDINETSCLWHEDLIWLRAEVQNEDGIAFTQPIQLVEKMNNIDYD